MVRVGVDENLAPELLADFPAEAEIVRLPRTIPIPRRRRLLDPSLLSQGCRSGLPAASRSQSGAVAHGRRGLGPSLASPHRHPLRRPRHPRHLRLRVGDRRDHGHHEAHPPLSRPAEQQQWRGFATVTDGFLSEPGAARGQYTVLAEDLSGKTVLIVGYGSIGAAIEARLTPFGVTMLRVARSARTSRPSARSLTPLLLPLADIVVLIVPLTEATRGLIGAPELALMKHGALLVNAARGPVVAHRCPGRRPSATPHSRRRRCHRPRAASPGHPLWSAPNCLITPHIGGSTPEFIYRAFRFAAQQVSRFIAGQPLENIVTDAGYWTPSTSSPSQHPLPSLFVLILVLLILILFVIVHDHLFVVVLFSSSSSYSSSRPLPRRRIVLLFLHSPLLPRPRRQALSAKRSS